MSHHPKSDRELDGISRRNFVRIGSVALAGGAGLGGRAFPAAAGKRPGLFPAPSQEARIQSYRTLGRTGWRVSDVGMGSVPLRESTVVRYAYDKGVNYFDTAEGYGNGSAERAIGEAMPHMDRAKIFIATKSRMRDGDSAEAIVDRVRKSLDRLKTDYVDSYSIHLCSTVAALSHPGYHAAMDQLKAEGRVRFTGVSYHGPGGGRDDSMADVLIAAAEDGRFDTVLLVYNFLNYEEGDRILAACKANDVGTTAMKTSPGVLRYEPLDPDNLTERQAAYLERLARRGQSRESALERLEAQTLRQKDLYERTRPFVERYGLTTEEQLRLGAVHWVLQNPDMHTACVAFTNFDLIDKVIPLSGNQLGAAETKLLEECRLALADQYCRHGCRACGASCPHDVPVSTIMRYAYYYEGQGYEKYAMSLYAGLKGKGASVCSDCLGDCAGACPHGIDIQPNMLQVHDLLTLA
ncbi:MAG: aldo/keto reductase [Gemmatimonadota bacterium]|nr:MAG: aldo/keto reductase [Gemmatimonadota bacterium]